MPKKTKKKSKKATVSAKPVYPIDVITHSYCEVTREASPGERWDADDLAYSTSIEGISPSKKDSSGDLVIDFQIEPGGTYYLVSVTHSDGDSFHHETGHVAFVDLFKTKKEADDLALWIRKKYDGKDNPKARKQSFDDQMNLIHNGKRYYVYQWSGYFNGIESINVDCVHTISRH